MLSMSSCADQNIAVCQGEQEIKDGGLESDVDMKKVKVKKPCLFI